MLDRDEQLWIALREEAGAFSDRRLTGTFVAKEEKRRALEGFIYQVAVVEECVEQKIRILGALLLSIREPKLDIGEAGVG